MVPRISATTWPRALASVARSGLRVLRTTRLVVHRGGLKVTLHNAVVKELCQVLEDTGAVVRTEALVPEFDPASTRRMDIWAFGVPGCQDLLVDLTVRSELAHTRHGKQYRPDDEREWLQWVAQQDSQKMATYPPAEGRHCTPFTFGVWGRCSPGAEALLTHLAGLAASVDRREGRAPVGRLQRWPTALDAAVQLGVARCLQAARLLYKTTSAG